MANTNTDSVAINIVCPDLGGLRGIWAGFETRGDPSGELLTLPGLFIAGNAVTSATVSFDLFDRLVAQIRRRECPLTVIRLDTGESFRPPPPPLTEAEQVEAKRARADKIVAKRRQQEAEEAKARADQAERERRQQEALADLEESRKRYREEMQRIDQLIAEDDKATAKAEAERLAAERALTGVEVKTSKPWKFW